MPKLAFKEEALRSSPRKSQAYPGRASSQMQTDSARTWNGGQLEQESPTVSGF